MSTQVLFWGLLVLSSQFSFGTNLTNVTWSHHVEQIFYRSNATDVLNIGTALSLDLNTKYGKMGWILFEAYSLYFELLNFKHGGVVINGTRYWVRLTIVDDQSDITRVEEITRDLHTQYNVNFFLGPYGSTLSKRAAEVVTQVNGLMVAPAAASPTVFENRPNIFGTLSPTNTWLETTFTKLRLLGSTIGYVYEDLAFTRGVCSRVVDLALSQSPGMRVTFGFQPEDALPDDANESMVEDRITRLAATSPDILLGCVYNNVCHRILNTLERIKFSPQAIVFTVCVTQADFTDVAGYRADFVSGISPWINSSTPAQLSQVTAQEFRDLYRLRHPLKTVPYQAASAFSAASILLSGIQSANTITDVSKVSQEVEQMKTTSVFGPVNFASNGQNQNTILLVQILPSNGRLATVVAPDAYKQGSFEFQYPKPSWDSLLCLNSDDYNVGHHGFFSDINRTCYPCAADSIAPYNKTLGYRKCQKMICPAGNMSVIYRPFNGSLGGAFCAKCPRGYFTPSSGFTACKACGKGQYQNAVGATACAYCEPGRYSGVQASLTCGECEAGRYSSASGSNECSNCPQGGLCEADAKGLFSNFTNAKGWYEYFQDNQRTLGKCYHGQDREACAARGLCYTDPDTGEISMEGPFCGNCKKGYGYRRFDKVCHKCESFSLSLLFVSINLAIITVISIFMFLIVVRSDMTKPKNINAIILKQVLNYIGMYQVISELIHLRVPFWTPEFFDHILWVAYLILGSNTPEFIIKASDCLAQKLSTHSYEVYAWLGLLWVPLWCTLCGIVFVVYWVVKVNVFRKKRPRASRLLTLLIVSLFVIHPRTTELSLVPFRCKYFDKPRLLLDTNLVCNASGFTRGQFFGALGFVLFGLGIPLAALFLLVTYNRKGGLQQGHSINTVGFLYQGLEPGCFYFECVFMLRKVLYPLIIHLPALTAESLQDDRTLKCSCMLALAVFFLAIHLVCGPYDNRTFFALDRVEAASLWAILVTLLVQLWLDISDHAFGFNSDDNGDTDGTQARKDMRDTVAILLVIYFHARFLCLVGYLLLRPSLVRILKWRSLIHGFVEVQEDGLHIIDVDSRGLDLFTSMFQELIELLLQSRQKISYNELIHSLQYMCVNCNYHRRKDRYHVGLIDDDDHTAFNRTVGEALMKRAEMRRKLQKGANVVNKVLFACCGGRYKLRAGGPNDAIIRLESGGVTPSTFGTTGSTGDSIHRSDSNKFDVAGSKGTSGRPSTNSDVSLGDSIDFGTAVSEEHQMVMQELDMLKHFNLQSLERCYGERFTIDELHTSMIRLHRDIGRPEKHAKKHLDAHVARSRFSEALNDGNVPGAEEISDEVPRDEEADLQEELDTLKHKLQQMRETHSHTMKIHRERLVELRKEREERVERIKNRLRFSKLKTSSEWSLSAEDTQESGNLKAAANGSQDRATSGLPMDGTAARSSTLSLGISSYDIAALTQRSNVTMDVHATGSKPIGQYRGTDKHRTNGSMDSVQHGSGYSSEVAELTVNYKAGRFGTQCDTDGRVRLVEVGSQADLAGVEEGMTMSRINGEAFRSTLRLKNSSHGETEGYEEWCDGEEEYQLTPCQVVYEKTAQREIFGNSNVVARKASTLSEDTRDSDVHHEDTVEALRNFNAFLEGNEVSPRKGAPPKRSSVNNAMAAIQQLGEEACPTFCKSCHRDCEEHAQFCSNCGRALRKMLASPEHLQAEEEKYNKVREETQAIQDQIFAVEIALDQVTAVIETNAQKLHKAEDMLLAADATIKMQETDVGHKISLVQSIAGEWRRVAGHKSGMSNLKIEASGKYTYAAADGQREGTIHVMNEGKRQLNFVHNEGGHDRIFMVSPDGKSMEGNCPQTKHAWTFQKVDIEDFLAKQGYA